MKRSDLLAELQAENAGYEALLAEIGEDRMEQPGVAGEWSVKDVVAHLAAWRRRTVGRLAAVARGEPEPAPPWPAHLQEDDEINAWFHRQDRDRSVKETLAESRRVFEGLAAAVAALPQEALDDPARFPWMEGASLSGATLFSHFHDEHEADMRALAARHSATALNP